MCWFITKHSPVAEDHAVIYKYRTVWKVLEGAGRPLAQKIYVFEDPDNKGAPIYKDVGNVKVLATLNADLSCIPFWQLTQEMGKDGETYCKWFLLSDPNSFLE